MPEETIEAVGHEILMDLGLDCGRCIALGLGPPIWRAQHRSFLGNIRDRMNMHLLCVKRRDVSSRLKYCLLYTSPSPRDRG
eukprot:3408643-Amphidinium_carterae.1